MTALFDATVNAYVFMHSQSKLSDEGEQIFEGSLTDVIYKFISSRAYYTPVRTLLLSPEHDPCILILQRGSRHEPSVVRLMHPPPDAWAEITGADLTSPRERAIVLADVEQRVSKLEGWRESHKEVNIVEVLRDYELRIAKLEAQVNPFSGFRREEG